MLKNARSYLTHLKEIALEILFPELCAGCAIKLTSECKESGLCAECFAKIDIKSAFTCGECGARLPAQAGLPKGKKTCHPRVPFLLAAATGYDNELTKKFIHELKYGKKTAFARPLASLIAKHCSKLNINLSEWELVPIPLHPSRERERGFNQSQIIAEFLAAQTPAKLSAQKILIRAKHTLPQAELGKKERLENMKDSFAIFENAHIPPNIILVDDVSTSGATMREAAETLKNAGAKKIIGAVAAKA